jgi:uncharacterized membrane protein (DUF106 family)
MIWSGLTTTTVYVTACMDTEEVEQEKNKMKELQRQLKETTSLVKNLLSRLNDL